MKNICYGWDCVSLVEEQILNSLVSTIPTMESGESSHTKTLSLIRFISDVRTVINALILGGRMEGAKFKRLTEEYGIDEGSPWARAIIVFDGIVFYLLAKPYIDVYDVDVLVDSISSISESPSTSVIVPVVAGYEYSYDAERYAKSIEVEILRLGL
jgi:hypothetical protein